MRYLLDRLREPGTLRSLVWVLLSVAGLQVTDATVAQASLALSAILGVVSALLPERSTEAAETVAQAAAQANETVAKAASAATEAKAAASQATQLVGSARALAETVNVHVLQSKPGPGPEYMGR